MTGAEVLCLTAIKEHYAAHGRPARVSDVMRALGYRSRATAHRSMSSLVDQGLLLPPKSYGEPMTLAPDRSASA